MHGKKISSVVRSTGSKFEAECLAKESRTQHNVPGAISFASLVDILLPLYEVQKVDRCCVVIDIHYVKEYLKYPISSFLEVHTMIQSISQSLFHGTGPLVVNKGMFFSLAQKICDIRHLLLGHIIDTNPYPFIQEGLGIYSHVGSGDYVWDKNASGDHLHFSEEQILDARVLGADLLKGLVRVPVANARVLDWLIGHPHQIPIEIWKGKKIFFGGTLYEGANENLYVRYLDCTSDHLHGSVLGLSVELDSLSYSLLLL